MLKYIAKSSKSIFCVESEKLSCRSRFAGKFDAEIRRTIFLNI